MAPLPPPPSPPLSRFSSADLHSLLAPYTVTAGPQLTFTNWATTFRSTTSAVFKPQTVEQVRWVVELARREGKELRAFGAGHSPSDIVCTEGYVVDLKGLNRVLEVDGETQTFHAEGGIILKDLHPVILEKGNLALSSLGSISDQTLAGAISTSTHGSGVTFGSLSTCATFLDIVLPLPDAPVVRCSREEESDLFLSALCGIGAVGVVVGVGMRAEKAFKLEEECFSMEFEEYRKRWKEIAESAEHVRCWWFPQVARVKVSRMNRTIKPLTPAPSALATYTTSTLLAHHFHAVALTVARAVPSLLPYHAWVMWTLVHQPGPVRWGYFLRKLFEGLWGGRGPWPRLEDVSDADEEEKEEEKVALLSSPKASPPSSPSRSLSPSLTSPPLQKSSLAVPPSDLLTPPLTPPVPLSPSSGFDSLTGQLLSLPSSPRVSTTISTGAEGRKRSPLASEIEVELEKLPEAEMGASVGSLEKVEREREGGVEHNRLPWPILEDEPIYRVAAGVDIFNYDCGFPQYTYESSITYSSTSSALSTIQAWHTRALQEPGYPLKAHFPIEIRFTEADDVWLSPTYKQRATYLGTIQYRPFNLPVPYRSHFTLFSSLLHRRFSGRPHWAKSHHLPPSELRKLYPKFDDFLAVRARVDPQGVLANSYVKRHLLGTEGEGEEGMRRSVRRFKERA
ncbi:hypothetical protein JCM8547_006954 [Rhodosporidiobolus lusitaniae]